MSNVTVNISFQKKLLEEIDETARRESRSRSELLREAARAYVQRRQQWDQVFELGNRLASKRRLAEADVAREIRSVRKRRRAAE